MKKYCLLAALFFSACVSNNAPTSKPVAKSATSVNQCENTSYVDSKDYKNLSCKSVVKYKNNRKVVNLEFENLLKKEQNYRVKITWYDKDGLATSDVSERLTTEYITINARDNKNVLFLAPSDDSVNFKTVVENIKSIPKTALYDKKHSKMGDNDFAIAADTIMKNMYIKKIRSEDFLNCGEMKCKIFVNNIKNRTRTDFPVRIIKDEIINAIQDYDLANYTDAIAGDGSANTAYSNVYSATEGNENFNQNKIVQRGQLEGPTHSLDGIITQNTDIEKKEVGYYLDMSISDLRTGTVEWKGRAKILGKKY